MNIKRRIEKKFEILASALYHHPILTLLICSFVIGILVSPITTIKVDTSTEGMLHANDPELIKFNDFRDEFGVSDMIAVGIKANPVFSEQFLRTLKKIHTDIENEVPFVSKVTSLVNVRNTYGKDDTLFVEDLLQTWPVTSEDFLELKNKSLKNPYYINNIVSADGTFAAIVIETSAKINEAGLTTTSDVDGFEENDNTGTIPNTIPIQRYSNEKDNKKIIDAIRVVLARYDNPDMSISLTGRPVTKEAYNRITRQDFRFILIMAFVFSALFLFALFRRISGIILPFIPVFSALLSTLGLMAYFGSPISLFSKILPGFMIAIGIAGSIHILAVFYRKFEQTNNKEESIVYAFGHSGLAIVMTSLTTAAGLLSFSFSELAALGHLGLFSAIGVVLALIYTIFTFPALIAIIPIKKVKTKQVKVQGTMLDRILLAFAHFSHSNPLKIMFVCLILTIISIYGTTNLKFSHNSIYFLPKGEPVKNDTLSIDKELGGVLTLRGVVDTNKKNGLHDPAMLNKIQKLTTNLESFKNEEIFIGKVFSINDILKETNQALHNNTSAFYSIPQEKDLIAQELLLFENSGSEDLEKIVDMNYGKTVISVKIPYVDYSIISDFIIIFEKKFNEVFGQGYDVIITGMPALMGTVIPAAQKSMAKSYVIAAFVITLLMILLVGSLKYGLISMVPNLFPIVFVMGFMGLSGIRIDMATLMIGSIAIGLVVDDTMHFMYNFHKYLDIKGDVHEAIKETMLGTGRALLITSLVLCSFFFTIASASLKSTAKFGLFTGIVIIIALLADFIILPALLTLMMKWEKATDTFRNKAVVESS